MKWLLLPLMLALGACATTSRPLSVAGARPMDRERLLAVALSAPSAERTVPVRIVREPASLGRLMGTMLVVDGNPVAMLQPGRATTIYLAPGPHVFAIGYAKRPDTRPLVRRELAVGPGLRNDFFLRLHRGALPAIARFGDGAEGAVDPDPGAPAYTLPHCPDARTDDAGGVEGPQLVDGRICIAPLPAPVRATMVPSWSDLGNLEEYADPATVAEAVDAAICAAGFGAWLKGKVGQHLDEHQRYIYTRRAGWIDLKHVVSSASNPGASIPGLSRMLPWVIEVAQVQVAPMSAFLREDTVSNHLGADAAVRHAATLGRGGSRGEIVQRALARLGPMTREEALRAFGIAVPDASAAVRGESAAPAADRSSAPRG